MDQCPDCGSDYTDDIGWDIWTTDDDEDVIEEYQYQCCKCGVFFFQEISMKQGKLPIRTHKE